MRRGRKKNPEEKEEGDTGIRDSRAVTSPLSGPMPGHCVIRRCKVLVSS